MKIHLPVDAVANFIHLEYDKNVIRKTKILIIM